MSRYPTATIKAVEDLIASAACDATRHRVRGSPFDIERAEWLEAKAEKLKTGLDRLKGESHE